MDRNVYYKSLFEFVITFHQSTAKNHTYIYVPLSKIFKLATRARSIHQMVKSMLTATQTEWPADANSSELVKLSITLKQLCEMYYAQALFDN